jgi:ribonuclease HI
MDERRTGDVGGGRVGEEMLIAHCDGGSRGNPGPAGYGVVIEDSTGAPVAELSEYLGVKTNNFAEYSALLAALEYALKHGHSRLRVVADSELMVKQMKGQYRVNSPDLRPLWEEAKRRTARLDRFEIQHVLRGKNKGADRLANLAMDRGMGRTGREGSGQEGTGTIHPKREVGAVPAAPAHKPRIARPAAPEQTSLPLPPRKPASVLRGFVKNGVVHLLEGELPENSFVRVTPE